MGSAVRPTIVHELKEFWPDDDLPVRRRVPDKGPRFLWQSGQSGGGNPLSKSWTEGTAVRVCEHNGGEILKVHFPEARSVLRLLVPSRATMMCGLLESFELHVLLTVDSG